MVFRGGRCVTDCERNSLPRASHSAPLRLPARTRRDSERTNGCTGRVAVGGEGPGTRWVVGAKASANYVTYQGRWRWPGPEQRGTGWSSSL